MFTFILILAIVVAILLMLVVLVQNPKGGGLASNFSSGNQIFGAAKTSDLLEKLTWGFAIAIIVISLFVSSYNTPSIADDAPDARTDLDALIEGADLPVVPQNVPSTKDLDKGNDENLSQPIQAPETSEAPATSED